MARHVRVNPFNPGTAERTLFDHYRRNKAAAEAAERAAALASTEALRALGHGDKVTPLLALPVFGETK